MTRAESGTPRLLTFLFLASALAATDASSGGSTPGELRGAYMGQRPPGDSPELFLPGVVSTGMDELNSVFSPDGKTFLFSIKLPGQRHHTLVSMHQAGGRWTDPEVLPFSGVYGDADPAFDASGERVFFISTRPDQLGGEAQQQVALAAGLTGRRDVPLADVAETAVDHLGRPAGGPGGEILALDDEGAHPARGRVPQHAGTGDSAADDQQIHAVAGRRLEVPGAVGKRPALARGPGHATSKRAPGPISPSDSRRSTSAMIAVSL